MELLQGETLQQRLARGPLDDGEFVEIATALTGALDAAHASGIIHRDIKPANIFLTGHGPKILDFGLAKATVRQPVAGASMQSTSSPTGGLTEHGHTVGTVAYMSPEQLRGEDVDARTDLFSLGLVLYEMATGRAGVWRRNERHDFRARSCTSSRARLDRSGRRCPHGSKRSS